MNKKIRQITESAVLLALLVCLQALTKPMGQLVTGSCVNVILAVTALVAGLSSAVVVALVSPVLAFLLGIAPQILTVPAIMVGNAVYVVLLFVIAGKSKNIVRKIAAWLVAAAAKFAALYAIVVLLICGVLSVVFLRPGQAQQAQIWSDGKLIKTVLLSVDQEFTVESADGFNTVTVRDGKIAVTEANCPDQYCVRQGFCNSGEQIVCLPHKLVISFIGESEIDGFVG